MPKTTRSKKTTSNVGLVTPTKAAATTTTRNDGAPEPTDEHTFKAKDGLYYKSYEAMARANKQANEQRIKNLGLDSYSGSSSRRKLAVVTPTKKRREQQIQQPTRRSRRVAKEPVLFVPDLPPTEGMETHTKPKRRLIRPVTPETDVIASPKLAKLGKLYPDAEVWMAEMEKYLIEQEQLSNQNHRSVLRQVEKLCSGAGVTYHRWPGQIYFCKGERLALSWDMNALYDRAVEYENEYGRDLGNGWLLRHPIKKIHNFQHFLLEQLEEKDTGSDE